MARNEEKNASLLNRFVSQADETRKGIFNVTERRPHIASEVTDLKKAEYWLRDVKFEISKKISYIQNAGLGEHRIRDLNDEINKLLKVKWHWEEQIIKLGGPNYHKKTLEASGKEITGQQGYQYFGAAQNLPGVRELFEKEDVEAEVRKTRKELFKGVKPDYYGWRDEEDPNLLLHEQMAEMENQQRVINEWRSKQSGLGKLDAEELAERKRKLQAEADSMAKAYVHVPSNEEIQEILLKKKKQNLLDKYMSVDAQKNLDDTKELVEGKTPPKMQFTKKRDRETKN
jgi:pre-mRNA-splicing factor ISY1